MQTDIQGLLDKGETIIWSGQPDLQAIKNTRHAGTGIMNKLMSIFVVGIFLWLVLDPSTTWNTGPIMNYIWIAAIAGGLWLAYSRLFANPKKLRRWAESLAYVISNRRILIIKDGKIDQAFTLSDVLQTRLCERKGAPGFNDLIWEKRAIDRRASSGNIRYVSPLEWEQAETGFKALADADSVKHILDDWIHTQKNTTQRADNNFISSQSTDTVDEVAADPVKSSY